MPQHILILFSLCTDGEMYPKCKYHEVGSNGNTNYHTIGQHLQKTSSTFLCPMVGNPWHGSFKRLYTLIGPLQGNGWWWKWWGGIKFLKGFRRAASHQWNNRFVPTNVGPPSIGLTLNNDRVKCLESSRAYPIWWNCLENWPAGLSRSEWLCGEEVERGERKESWNANPCGSCNPRHSDFDVVSHHFPWCVAHGNSFGC